MNLPISDYSAVTICEQVYFEMFAGDTSERELSCTDAATHYALTQQAAMQTMTLPADLEVIGDEG